MIILQGDATSPIKRPAIIAHVCNDIGAWGAGFVLAVSSKWPFVRDDYLGLKGRMHRGDIQMVMVDDGIHVCNMIAQKGIRSRTNPVPLDMDSLGSCLSKLATEAELTGSSVHMPKIGCGLAGGDWNEVSTLITQKLVGIEVFVYVQ